MPVYNGEVYLRDTLESIIAHYQDFELLIVDDSSTDNS
jgi:glycosyltransferase involved in cell wall biosynthesis